MVKFIKKRCQIKSKMKYFTLEMFSNASAQLFQDRSLISLTNFAPEQFHLEGL